MIPTNNKFVIDWINEMAAMTQPDQIVWIDGSEEQANELRKQAMAQKQQYMQGMICNKDYLGIFGQAEEMLEHSPAAKACEADIALAEKLDISGLKQQRRKNAAQLLEAFGDIAIFSDVEVKTKDTKRG